MLLLWSGGCDSTLVLADRLKAGEPIRTLAISTLQLPHDKQQRHAREQIVKHFKAKEITWPHVEVQIKHHYPFGYKNQIALTGVIPGLWIGVGAAYLDNDEDLGAAYIKGDNAIHWLEHIFASFRSLQAISNRTGQLLLPTEWRSKAEIIIGLKKHRLYRKTWWCESPKKQGNACGTCQPCLTHKAAQWAIRNHADYNLHGEDCRFVSSYRTSNRKAIDRKKPALKSPF